VHASWPAIRRPHGREAFDEQGQADTIIANVSICERAYRILTERIGLRRNIIFDPNILRWATGSRKTQSLQQGFHRGAAVIKRGEEAQGYQRRRQQCRSRSAGKLNRSARRASCCFM